MRYEAPNSLDQAVALLAKETGDARVLAGGTDLLVQMRTDILDPVLFEKTGRVIAKARQQRVQFARQRVIGAKFVNASFCG